jgi:N-acetylmuramoyl-L-alanine amidase
VASLFTIAAVLYLAFSGLVSKTSQPPLALDDLTKAAIFAAISDDNERIRVVGLIYQRPLTDDEILRVREIRRTFDPPPTITADAEREIRNAKTPKDLEFALATIDIKPCGGSFAFQIAGTSLACSNGRRVPAMATTNAGPLLLSRDALVFHFTGSNRTEGDLRILSGANPAIKASVHLVIARSGAVVQLVPLDHEAWHAGKSEWKEKGITDLNSHSIGITLTNFGQLTKKPDGTFVGAGTIPVPLDRITTIDAGDNKTYWETYTPEQISAAEGIVRAFRAQQPDIGILGHSDIAPMRTDPGPAFPIAKLRKN